MIDRDLAELYGVETKRINEQVKRNSSRFPERYCFQLTEKEKDELVANCDHLSSLKYSYQLPHVFTEHGVAMLSTVLKSETAVTISFLIIDSFVAMRRFLHENATVFQRLDTLERKQLETDSKFKQLFDALQQVGLIPKQGIFYDGQVFDAYTFAADIVRKVSCTISAYR